jgi:pyridoxal phosphate enzyme (YggS family)
MDMSISENLTYLRKQIPEHVKMVAVSKTKPVEALMIAYNAGQRIFGENKAQEMTAKQPLMPVDVQWHFIGHLQTNKVKFIAPFVSMVESVDSLKLLVEINRLAANCNRLIDCLLQFHISDEKTKFGLDLDECHQLLNSESFQKMANIRICGVMGMASFTENTETVRGEFQKLKSIFDQLKNTWFKGVPHFCEISMGMSGDYQIAIAEGSTIVRIGSSIFGERNY